MPLPFFRFFPQRWLGSGKVLAMPLEARGAYIHLMAAMWNRGGGRCELPNDDGALMRMVGATPQQWRKIKPWLQEILDFGDVVTETNLLAEFRIAQEKSSKATVAANTRWHGEDANVYADAQADADAAAHADGYAPAMPPRDTEIKELRTPPNPPTRGMAVRKADKPYSEEFEGFWRVYPRQEEKRPAWAAWQARLADKQFPVTAEQLTVSASRYAQATRDSDPTYRKLPATFLSSKRPYEHYLQAGSERRGNNPDSPPSRNPAFVDKGAPR